MSHTQTKAGVMGWPVAHSLSPALHTYWLNKYGVDGTYEHLPVKPEDLGSAITSLRANGFAGVNVTVPHKELASRQVDELDEVARELGAVNLITVQENGRLEGRNTDGFGFLENLNAAAPGLKLEGAKAVVLGAGGTAKAVAHALKFQGTFVCIANRTQSKAEAIAKQLGNLDVVPWSERSAALTDAKLLVNTTTLGMTGQPDLDVDLVGMAPKACVADCVYAPLETGLFRAARKRGFTSVDGLGMLMHQARPAFKAWFGVDPDVTPALRAHLLKVQAEMQQ